jgi:hypothetical protein
MMKTTFGVFCLVIGTAALAQAGKVDVSTCGQLLEPGMKGTLTANLDACPSDAAAITLHDGAKLDLNGFAITSGDIGIVCQDRCAIRGPGDVTGARLGISLRGIQNARLTLKDVNIHDNTEYGIVHEFGVEQGKEPLARLSNVAVQNNGGTGIFLFRSKLVATELTVTDNGFNGIGGLLMFRLKRATVQRNLRTGISAEFGSGRLIDSLLSFNGTLESDADIKTVTPPILIRSECGFSADYGTGDPWGVCAGDETP